MTNFTGQPNPEDERGPNDVAVESNAEGTALSPGGYPLMPPPQDPRLLPTLSDVGKPEVNEAYGGSGIAPEGPVDKEALKEKIIAAFKEIYDPEIPVNIYDLGLIYDIETDDEAKVEVSMTLTAPGCPVAGYLVEQVAQQAGSVEGVQTSHVSLTWDPPWTKYRMTEAAMLELGLL